MPSELDLFPILTALVALGVLFLFEIAALAHVLFRHAVLANEEGVDSVHLIALENGLLAVAARGVKRCSKWVAHLFCENNSSLKC